MILFDLIKKGKTTFFTFSLLISVSMPLNAQQNATSAYKPDTANLRVGMAGTSPFIFKSSNGQFDGIALEIWQKIASTANWKSNYSDYESVSTALDSLQNGKLDVVIGPISITSQRAEKVRFSQPYYQSSLSIMSRVDKKGLFERIAPFLSYRLAIAILIFLFILSIVGTLIWLAERKVSPEQFPPKPAPGIANGMWLAIVTMSTTGYGDRAPVTFWGRVIAGSWMVISIIFATTMVAGIASTLTLTGMETSTITNISQVAGKKVATIQNSPAGNFVKKYKARQISVVNLETAFQKLKDKEVVAIVYDRPQLLYFLKQHPDAGIQVGKEEYFKQGYGFAFPKKSKLASRTNVILLNLMEQNRIIPITNEWLGDE
jgi:polar amino acid transport system substrate-binding protein